MWAQGDEMRRRGEAFAQQERTSYPVYSLKLKQKLLQEAAASRRTKVRPSPWTQAEPLPGAQGLMAFYVFCCIFVFTHLRIIPTS